MVYFFPMKAASTWSIEKELMEITSKPNWMDASIDLGLVTENNVNELTISEFLAWKIYYETAVMGFKIASKFGEGKFILKCVITPTFGISLEENLELWVKRRRLFEDSNIHTPKLYFWGRAELIEDFIPFSLHEYLSIQSASNVLADEIMNYATFLDLLGFTAINPFDDLRTDGKHLYAVDFGSDLGDPGPECKNIYRSAAKTWLKQFSRLA